MGMLASVIPKYVVHPIDGKYACVYTIALRVCQHVVFVVGSCK